MRTRSLGDTGVVLSEIALGTWGLASGAYGPVPAERFEAVVREAFDRGITTFDLAPIWGDGEGERRLAVALGPERRSRASLIVRAGQVLSNGRPSGRFDSQSILESVEGSLLRLGREQIDVLLLHDPPRKVLASEMFLKGVEHLVRSGKVRAWGAAIATADEARDVLRLGGKAVGLVHHLLEPHLLYELEPALKEAGAGAIVRSPLCYGLLAGIWSAETEFPPGDHRSRRWTRESFRVRIGQVEDLRFLVHDEVPDLATAALRFALASPVGSTVAVGARTVAQVAHAAAASVEPPGLPAQDLARLQAMHRAAGAP